MSINDINGNNAIKKEYAAGSPGHVAHAKYFYFDSDASDTGELKILCGGHEKCASDFSIARHNFPFYAIIFTLKGKGSYTCNGHKHGLQYGSLTTILPNVPHLLESDAAAPMEQIFVICLGERITELCERSSLNSRQVISVSRPHATSVIFQDILHVGFSKPRFAQEICECYLKAVILDQAQNRLNEEFGSASYESFLRCKQHIDDNFITIQSSAELAEKCCFDVRYIARLFRKYENTRPYDYLMQLKIDKALNLLITSNLNINQIALMTGFDDPYHFSRIFKKKLNMSPSRYRANIAYRKM